MSKTTSLTRIAVNFLATFLTTAEAAEIFKANNNDALNVGTSWTTLVVPGPGDLATWNSITTAANRTNTLGGDLSWGGLRIFAPGGVVNLSAGNTLTLGTNGIIMTNATVNLVLSNNIELGASQVWDGANTRQIMVYGSVSGAAGNTLTKAGSNRVDLAAANTFAGDVIVNGGQLRVVHPAGLGNSSNTRINPSIVGTAQDAGTQLALGTNVAPSGITLTMTCTTNGGDLRTTLMCAGTTAGFSSGWNGPIVATGDASVQFHNNGAGNALVIGGNVTASNFTGTLRSRGGGSNAFLGTINIPSGNFVKHEAGPLLINAPGNSWGTTALQNGTTVIGADNALPPATIITFGNAANNGLLDLNGHTQTISGLAISGTGTGSKIFSSHTTTDSTLIFNGVIFTSFAGTIDDNSGTSPGAPRMNFTVSSGALTLAPTTWHNTYSGTTTVNGGASLTERSDQAGGGPLVVADGATFGVQVAAVGSSLAVSSANLGTSSDCTLNLDLGLGNPTAAPIAAGVLAAQGTVTINVQGLGLLQGQFPLISHSGSIGGTGFNAFTLGPLPLGVVTAYLSNNTTSVDLVIELAAGAKLWTGANGSNWDINTTTNWTNLATGQPDTYGENAQTGDLVVFDDTSSLKTVNLVASVKPVIATFSNSLPYTISGSGAIYGNGALVKGSTGPLALNSANSFSGGATHHEGVLQLGNDAALGTGRVSFPTAGAVVSSVNTAARTLANNLTFAADATLGDPVNSGLLTFSGGISLNNGTRNLTLNSDVVWTGTSTNGRINKLGTGTLTIKGLADWNGVAEVRNGTLILDGATVTNNNAFRPDTDQPNGLARLVITNGALFILTANNGNIRAGNDGNTLGTNIVDIAGTVRMPNATSPDGRIIPGAGSVLGIVNLLPGGDAQVRSVEHGGTNASQFNFAGGLLRARTNNSAFMQGLTEVFVRDGGAFVDTAGWDVTIAQNLLAGGAGGLTKSGLGTLTLTGTNTYSGATVVSAGRLVIAPAHAGGGAITVSDGTTLGILANVGGPTLNASSLNLGTSGTTTIEFDFGDNTNTTTALLNGGTVTASGTVKIDIKSSALTAGVIPLLKYNSLVGGGYGAFSLGSVPRGFLAALQNNIGTSTIELNISAVDRLTWTGATNGIWDINTTTNWTLSGLSALYLDGDAVLFDDTASGSTTVNLAANVAPRSVTVNNATKAYTLQGTNGISGTATFTKSGSGVATVATPNTYSGLTTISAGQLKLGASNVLPDGAGKGSVVLNATLDLNGFSDGINGLSGVGIVNNSGAGASALTIGNNNSSSTFSGTAQNSASPLSLAKVGTGTLQLTSANAHSGGVAVNAGTLQITSGASLGTGTLTMGGGTLALPGALTITNLLAFSADNSRLTNQANTGVMVFNGGLDFQGGLRYIYFDNDTTLSGPLVGGGGIERKFGLTTLTLQGLTGDLLGNLEIREGNVIFDGVSITKSANGIRLMCTVTNGISRLVVTNGAAIQMTGAGQNLRVGSSAPNGETTATNIADIAGVIAWPPGNAAGAVQIGANATLCELNLLSGGALRIRGITPQQTTGISRWNFNGGVLSPITNNATFFEGLSEANVRAGGAIIDTAGFDITINQLLLDGGGGGGGLTKLGTGTLLLNGINTYLGSTVVSNGVLGGFGVIAGPITVRAGGALSPGTSIGTLTVNNGLTLNPGSTTLVEVDASVGTSDLIQGVTLANYGGTLQVANLGGTLAAGQSYHIVSAANAIGNFSSIMPSPGGGLAWSFNPTSGMLGVISGGSTVPTNLTYSVTGGQITLAWPQSYVGWYLQVQTNPIAIGLSSNWVTLTNSSTTNSVAFPVVGANGTVFYRMSLQP